MSFDPSWLETRWRFDAAARHTALASFVCDRIAPETGPWNIIDVGAGLGANVRHIAPALEGDQRWWLVDNDTTLLARAPAALTGWAAELGWGAEGGPAGVTLHSPHGTIDLKPTLGSLMTLDKHTPLESAGLITANAVFDLLSEAQFTDFVSLLRPSRAALWATLNVTGMAFSTIGEPHAGDASQRDADRWVVQQYSAHMRRQRAEAGRAMGDECGLAMIRTLRAAGYRVESGPSPWHIGPSPSDTNMMIFMLDFIASAVPEMCTQEELPRFERWLDRRRRDAAQHRLSLRVDHVDILAWRP